MIMWNDNVFMIIRKLKRIYKFEHSVEWNCSSNKCAFRAFKLPLEWRNYESHNKNIAMNLTSLI